MEKTNNEKVKSKRDLALERMRGKYPDKNFDDEDVFYGQINDDYDDYDKQISGYKEREKAFSDMFTSDPRSAAFLTNWRKGGDPMVELVRQFGTDIKDAIDDPERQEAIAAANKEYLERVSKEKSYEEEYKSNLEASLKMLEKYQQEQNMSDEQLDELMEAVLQLAKDAVVGKFTPETLEMVRKSLSHDADVDMAREEGNIKGRNSKITEMLRKGSKGDGMAQLGSKNGSQQEQPRMSMGIFDLAKGAK